MKLVVALIRRDLGFATSGGAMLPILFFLLVATLYPFGIGPDGALLERTGGGMLWIAALLAALLPVDRLISPDAESGVFDQLSIRGAGDEMVASAKILAHWLSFGPPLMIAAIPAAALLRLNEPTLIQLELGLLLGTPGLAALAVMVAGITAGLRRTGALAGLLMLPLAVPLLIFGAGSLGDTSGSALKLLGACSLLLCAIAPFATGAAIKAMRD